MSEGRLLSERSSNQLKIIVKYNVTETTKEGQQPEI